MDTTKKYTRMCEKAKEVQEEWIGMPKEKRYGTLIRYRTFLGILAPNNEPIEFEGLAAVIAETLAFKTWLKEGETLIVTAAELEPYDDRGTPLFRQDQLQEMVIYKDFEDLLLKLENWYIYIKGRDKYTSMEQLWLAFVMWEKYRKVWNEEKEEWVSKRED